MEIVEERLKAAEEQLAFWQEQAAAAARQVAMWQGAVEALRGVLESAATPVAQVEESGGE